jgi:hypothetical protein
MTDEHSCPQRHRSLERCGTPLAEYSRRTRDNLVNFPMDSGCFDIPGCGCLGDDNVISEEGDLLQVKETRGLSCQKSRLKLQPGEVWGVAVEA